MDTNRSPGVGPLTWGTLGLLLVSWVLLAREVFDALTRLVGADLRRAAWLVLLSFGAHVICGLVAWRGRRRLAVGITCYLSALGYTALSGVNLAAREFQLNVPSLVPGVYYAWGAAWVTGIPVLLWLMWRGRFRTDDG